MVQGYFRYPTLHGDQVVFTSEDDLWTVSASGGIARRLTSGLGQASHPALSPDGRWIAFSGRDEGPTEVYVMPAAGGEARRLTHLGAVFSIVAGWDPRGRIVFASDAAQPFTGILRLHAMSPTGGRPELLPTGPALTVSFGPGGGVVIGRGRREASHWKRYRGGTAGDLWIDREGKGDFVRLLSIEGNPTHPLWVGGRIYFLSDHEGVGNLYSCLPTGEDLSRHTHHEDYYMRHPSTDGRRIVYDCGADLHVFDPASGKSRKVEVDDCSPRAQTRRKFADAARYLEDAALHPKGHLLAVVSRGKAFSFGCWEGPVLQHGEAEGARYRLARWLASGKKLVLVSDALGEERLEVFEREAGTAPERLADIDIGRALEVKPSPRGDQVAISNHRNELLLVDLATKTRTVIDRSQHGEIAGFDWSPDGRWIAYGFVVNEHVSVLKLHEIFAGKTHVVTRPDARDGHPSFDPEGKLLCFISGRFYDPVYDNAHFDLGFPKGSRPCVLVLSRETQTPFLATPKPADEKPDKEKEKEKSETAEKPELVVKIDLEGIQDRVLAFPVPDGIYLQVEALEGKVIFTSVPPEGTLGNSSHYPSGTPPAKATLEVFDWKTLKAETLLSGISHFRSSLDRKMLVVRSGERLRVVKAGEKPEEGASKDPASRKNGWIDLGRVKVLVEPALEWRQMYREAWRLQRDHFWTEDMSQVDWQASYERYLPLLERAATRSEYADVIWEMQGELGTSHAYEMGGDYRPAPRYDVGFLGADLVWDERARGYRIVHLVRGDSWDEKRRSPLLTPGTKVREGELIFAVGGRALDKERSPESLLVHQAETEVLLSVGDDAGARREVVVKTLRDETPARYREWVEANRARVHVATGGRVGYVHVPDMGPLGYSEFHRSFLVETERDGLVVDVRFNRGGHVSPLLLEKLARRRIGFVKSRWFGVFPYPSDSPGGPLVAITNEWAGSDGDIFSHCFKLLRLGPLMGKRTWGGVIGISPRHLAVDGSLTTQPEFSFWFEDVGWGVENYGTDPDIEVEMRPQDHVSGKDPQLERAIAAALELLEKKPPLKPDLEKRPNLRAPRLPA